MCILHAGGHLIDYRRFSLFTYPGRSPLGGVTFAGFHAAGKGIPYWRTTEFYVAIYIIRGRGRLTDGNGRESALAAGDLMLLFPGLPHMYVPHPDEPWSEIWFTFAGPIFDLWAQRGLIEPSRPVHQLLPIDYWHHRFEWLLATGNRLAEQNPTEHACAIQLLLAEALGTSAGGASIDEDAAWLARASSLLDAESLVDAVSLERVADDLQVSYDQFRRRFKMLSGMTPYHFRVSRIMARACRLIETRRLSNRELSDILGFSSEFHFSRRFKQVVGTTPKEFRRRAHRDSSERLRPQRGARSDPD